MADPKGPETGQGAKGGSPARPRSPTLDLSATDVTPKPDPAAPKPATPQAAPGKPKPAETAASSAAASSSTGAAGQPKSASAASASSPADDLKASAPDKPPAAASGAPAPTAFAKPEPPKPETAKPQSAKPEPARPDPLKPASVAPSADRPAAPRTEPAAAKPATAASPPPREGVGVIGVTAAAVGGAAVATLIIAVFGKSLIGVPASDISRVMAVESKLDGVGRDVAALRGQMSKAAQATDTSAIDARLGEMSKTIEASNGRVSGVETELRSLSDEIGKPDPALGVLAGRVDGLELRFQEAPNAETLALLTGRVAGVESRTADLPTKETLTALGARIDAVGQKVAGATAPLSARVDALSEAVKARPTGDPTARLVVALGALDQALGAGRPFSAELGAVKAVAGGNAELAPLDPYATSGVPSRGELGSRLTSDLGRLAAPKTAQASVFERFVANAGGVVKVTPKGGATGDDPAALRAQVAAMGEAGDLEGALAARGRLDEAARAATEEWSALATARVSAENALNAARAAALGRLSAND